MTQKETVFEIVSQHPEGLRTGQIEHLCLAAGIGRGDRLLRFLQNEGKVTSRKKDGDNSKTWFAVHEYKFDGAQEVFI